MNTKKKYGAWSTILCIVGILFLIISYSISENPTLGEQIVIGLFFFPAIASMLMSIVLGIVGVVKNEKGCLKYVGIIIVSLLILGVLFAPIFMGVFGFKES